MVQFLFLHESVHFPIAFIEKTILSPLCSCLFSCVSGSDGKDSACDARDTASIPVLGRSPGEGNNNPLWYLCLENPMDRGARPSTVRGVTKSWTRLNH